MDLNDNNNVIESISKMPGKDVKMIDELLERMNRR